MPTPARQRPPALSPLAVNVEPIGPKWDQEHLATSLSDPIVSGQPAPLPVMESISNQVAADDRLYVDDGDWRRRTHLFPQGLIEVAQQAQKISSAHPGGYSSLQALMVGALENEVKRIRDSYNGGNPISPIKTATGNRYRYGVPAGR